MDYLDDVSPDSRPTRVGDTADAEPVRVAAGGSAGADLQASVEVGDLYARAGDHAQALRAYLALWESADEAPGLGLVRRIALCHERLGRHQEAIRLLAPVLAAVPDASGLDAEERLELGRCRLVLGKSYLEAGQMTEAQAEGLRATALLRDTRVPESGFAHNLLGTICFRRGDVDEAKVHFRAALEHFRVTGDVVNIALGYLNLGHLHKQRCEWDRALEHYQAAYYLRAAEGEYQDQGPIVQSLALVLMKIGRYEEARERLETALRRALELNSPARALRSRIALARLARESWEFEEAHAHLKACAASPEPLPEREGCLVLLEEAYLARHEEKYDDANTLAVRLRDRVERLAARGDLMIETLLLEAKLDLDRKRLEEAEAEFRHALALAQEERDRYQENRALLGLMDIAERQGRHEDSLARFNLLQDRHRHGGDQPSLANLFERRAELEEEVRGRAEEALAWMTRARDLWRKMALRRREALAEVRIARTLLALDRAHEARALIRSLRERFDPPVLAQPQIAHLLREVEDRSGEAEPDVPAGALDGEHAFFRLEEILHAEQGPGEKLRSVLGVLTEALGADGAVLARLDGKMLDAVSTVSMGRLHGKRSFPAAQLGLGEASGGRVLRVRPEEDGGRSPFTALVLPANFYGREHLVYLERRGPERGVFGRSDLEYGRVLVAGAARGLRPVGTETAPDLEKLESGIWLADVITQNSRMLSILELIRKVGDSDLTVLLQGETGTGKKLLAQAIHRTSGRRGRPLVTVDCAALPDSLLESELFGHRKGAFTGAIQDRVGLLEDANGGTIFLDEIDKAGLSVQRRFLHMLDSGEVRPVGATGYRRLDVRVVCATSCPDLLQEVAAGRFLKDLYYRLNDISITVPPLRERPDDVGLLAEWFIGRYGSSQGKEIGGVAPGFHAALAAHSWPGNVRELEKAIRRAVTLAESGTVLVPELLPSAVLESAAEDAPSANGTLREKLDRYERGLLADVLDRTEWNKSRAAAELGLTRKGLKNKIQRYKLDRRRPRRS